METRKSTPGLFIILSPLLLPLGVFLYLALTRQGMMAPATTETLPSPAPPVVKVAPPIAWTGSLDWALQTARSSGKPIFIDFYTDT